MSSTVLCIDDRQQMLKIRKANLENLGYSVLVADDCYSGMNLLKQTAVDAVLLEYKQEGMDAEAAAFHIKWLFPDVPIILLSAYSEMSERILWLVDEYAMKSAPAEELVRIIERSTHAQGKKSARNANATGHKAAVA